MTATTDRVSLVTPDWLAARRDDPTVRVIEIAGIGQDDLRAYRVGHVPGAVCWKWQEMLWDVCRRDFPSPEEFARRAAAAGIGNGTTVVFYSEDVQFGLYAWWMFRYCGHDKVCVLDGARYRWANEGRPLVQDVPAPFVPATYHPAPRNERMRIYRDEVLALLGQQDNVILDGRSPEEYGGQLVGVPGGPDVGAVRYGRIPGARHLPFSDLLNDDRSFKTPQELRALAATLGATGDADIIVYCRLSHRATVLYFALTELLGHKGVRVYDGSWIEWGNLVGVPVEC